MLTNHPFNFVCLLIICFFSFQIEERMKEKNDEDETNCKVTCDAETTMTTIKETS